MHFRKSCSGRDRWRPASILGRCKAGDDSLIPELADAW